MTFGFKILNKRKPTQSDLVSFETNGDVNKWKLTFTSLMASTSAPDDRSSLTTEVCPICEAIHKGVAWSCKTIENLLLEHLTLLSKKKYKIIAGLWVILNEMICFKN